MFKRKTVFILGAGASWHYGYPTGEELVAEVEQRARLLAKILDYLRTQSSIYPDLLKPVAPIVTMNDTEMNAPWLATIEKCEVFADRVRNAQPLVIDYFLGLNPDLEILGRFIVTWCILEFEHRDSSRTKWVKFVTSHLLAGVIESGDLFANQVSFVTFNYDSSLERALYIALASHSSISESDRNAFLSGERVIHVYGRVLSETEVAGLNHVDFSLLKPGGPFEKLIHLLNLIHSKADGIKVIAPKDKSQETSFSAARNAITESEVIYILGFGFDENNCQRLDLQQAIITASPPKLVMFTNKDDSNRINKRASRVTRGKYNSFAPGSPLFRGSSLRGPYVEKSTRDVYGALSLDFDWL